MRDSPNSYQERHFEVFKLIQQGDRDVAGTSEDPALPDDAGANSLGRAVD